MPNVEWCRRARLYLGKLMMGALLGLYGSATAYAAFVPSDSPLLTAGSVTPNVMLLVDDSGSMNSIIWASGFDPNADPVQVYNCSSDSNCLFINALDMTDTNFFVGNLRGGGCGFGYDGFYKVSTSSVICLKLPDPVGNGNTRYTTAYISYLISATSASRKDYTDGSVPNDYRINVARTVSAALVASNRNLRIGLATFNPPTNTNSGPGGNIARTISDLSQTSSTTANQATANYNALISSINGLDAIANTPLAETYYEVTRYFRGLAPYYNTTPTTYTSPIQYRCQRNYGVVITDGLPTYDRTFPTNDPQGGSKLPNWDGKNNDGDNLNGDGEGDTLYLDDIAKFAYDIDMRTGGTDAANKGWDATDFPKQNMFTYTVGFTAANAMLSDAAVYGNGTYYQATDSAGLNTALSAALNDITSRAGTGGGVATDSSSLSSTSVFFQTQYDPTDWRGTIKASAISADGTTNTAKPIWSTDKQIVPGITANYESWNSLTNAVIPLSFLSFSLPQQLVLSANLPLGISGTDLVQWSKGINRTGLKTRTVLLGDVINSTLAYASPTDNPASDPASDNSYSTYLDIKSNSMNPNLVVNANDGLVNVIDPSTGNRRYAYMPATVLANLRYVADPNYINGLSHKFLVDGQISIVDVQFASSWKTLAIGGAGSGGKGFYALQLFNAGASNTVKALWDISSVSTGFANMGYAYAKPEVAQLPDGRWAAFISNGYGSANGVASLFVVDVSNGALIKEIPVDTSGNNGLSSVKLRVNAQSVVQYAYGGDLKGQVWKFDFTGQTASAWKVGLGGSPLFTASGGASQPITAQPVVGNNPNGGKMVYFGTGKLLEAADKATTATQAFYAVWDNDGTSANYRESDLVAQAITSPAQFFTTTQNDVNYASKKGFYLPLIYNNFATGERIIYSPVLAFGRVQFTTAIVDTTDPCSSSGSGRFGDLDALNGKMLSYPVLDTNGDGQVNSADAISGGFLVSGGVPSVIRLNKANGNQAIVAGGIANSQTNIELGGASDRRIMWRQLR